MRIIVKRCKVWQSTRRESLPDETRTLFDHFNLPVPYEYGVNAKCPFCGGVSSLRKVSCLAPLIARAAQFSALSLCAQ